LQYTPQSLPSWLQLADAALGGHEPPFLQTPNLELVSSEQQSLLRSWPVFKHSEHVLASNEW
jgi:hypothetical protein